MYLDNIKSDLPVGLWGMDDAAGSEDLSGFGNNLTLTGVTYQRLPLVPDGGASVRFVQGSTAVIPLNTYSVDKPSTVEFWMKSNRQVGAVLSRGTDGVFLGTNGIHVYIGDDDHFAPVSDWSKRLYIAVIIDDKVEIYVNGEVKYSGTKIGLFTKTTNLVLGGAQFDIDALAIYNRALSSEIIAAHYALGQDFNLHANVAHIFGGETISVNDKSTESIIIEPNFESGEATNVNIDGGLSLDPVPGLEVVQTQPNLINDPSFEAGQNPFTGQAAGYTATVVGPDYKVDATNLATNPRMETLSGGTQVVVTNYFSNPSFEGGGTNGWSFGNGCTGSVVSDAGVTKFGTQVCQVVPGADITGSGAAVMVSEGITPPAGSTVGSARVWMRRSGPNTPTTMRVIFLCYQGNTYLGQAGNVTVSTTAGSPAAYNEARLENVPLKAGTDTVRIGIYPDGTTLPWPAGAPLLVDGAQMHFIQVLPDYFDGSTLPAGDFTYVWTGAANASTSTKTGKLVTMNGGNLLGAVSYAVASSVWAKSGTQSLRHISNYPTPGSAYIDLARDNGGIFGTLERGKTYTVMVTSHVEVARTRAPAIQWSVTGMPGESKVANADITPGDYDLRLTFTVPTDAAATSWRVRLYSNEPQGGPDCWWDNLLFVDGSYDGLYFDGYTQTDGVHVYAWTGAVDASTTEKRLVVNPRTGSKMLKLVNTGGSGAGTYYAILDQQLKPNTDYTLSGWVFTPATNIGGGSSGVVRIGGNGITTPINSSIPENTNQWSQVSVTMSTTGTVDTSSNDVVLYLFGSATSGEVVWFDDIAFNEGTYIRDSTYDLSRNKLSENDSMLTEFGGWSATTAELEDSGAHGSGVIHVYPSDTPGLFNDVTQDPNSFVSAYVQVLVGSIDDFHWDGDSETLVAEEEDWYRLISQSGSLNLLVDDPDAEFLFSAPQVESGQLTAFTPGGYTAAVAMVILS